MDIYTANIMDHYRQPRNYGCLVKADVKAQAANVSCGDKLSVSIRMEKDLIKEIKFEGQGCAISQAAISILSDKLIGKSPKEISAYDLPEVVSLLGVPISQRRRDCALLGLVAIKRALKVEGI